MVSARALVRGRELTAGSRVRLRPQGGADAFDLAIVGRAATVERVEDDLEGGLHLLVAVDRDPGGTPGGDALGHRFFIGLDEVDPLPSDESSRKVLVAGIGNVFHGDDGFGVEVVRRLRRRPVPDGVDITDFGIRGVDLMCALGDGHRTAILVGAAASGDAPGTVRVAEPDPDSGGFGGAAVDAHGLDPARVLRLARENGPVPPRILLVACEPSAQAADATWEMDLSAPVGAAVGETVRLIERLIAKELSAERELTPHREGAVS
ncbi:hydrogenase maturation protease [Actinomadura bangladeshensis]|uniref:hydrogenase maturation protease n=1 Tax=Actinomadura bangladeshensis TaxID=453573 RepID=UPI001A9CEC48|nr:hydrogenase maturation protease [Actinomadura bangladeshensis]